MNGRDDSTLISAALADRLGLTQAPQGLEGTLGDATVLIQVRTTSEEHSNVPILEVQARLPFWPVLDAGLRVEPTGSWDALRATGREGFVRRFDIQGNEPDRVATLVGEAAQEALDQSFVGDPGPQVHDGGIRWAWRARSPWPTTDTLTAALLQLPRAWAAIVEASRTLRPASCTEASVQLAGLQAPPGLCGHLGRIWACLLVGPPAAQGVPAKVMLRLPQQLPGSPRVVREETLDAEVRAAMLALDDMLPLELHAQGLDARGVVPAGRLADTLQATTALARALAG
jgi:hypothetical protein